MTMGRLPSGFVSLREAAVRIFALVALLPFLLLVFLLVLLLQRPDLVTPLQLEVSLLLPTAVPRWPPAGMIAVAPCSAAATLASRPLTGR